MMVGKVLFFDSWKGGIQHFLRLVPALNQAGFTTLFIHLGSWGNEEIIIKEEMIHGLVVRDISYYDNQNFDAILEAEQPSLTLFLSTHTFAHRAFNRFCLYRNIPTINLYHGFVRVQAVDTKESAYKVSFRAYALFALKRVPKLLTHTLPAYGRSLRKTKAAAADWLAFGKNVVEMFTKPSSLRVAGDAKTTRCLVYADADKQHAINIYGFNPEEVISVGNPDLIQFQFSLSQNSFGLRHNLKNRVEVMYVDTALTATGLIVNSQAAYMSHLLETHTALKKNNRKLLFKPHPETRRLCDLSVLTRAGIEIIDNSMFTQRLEDCCAVITEPSTLALIPGLMAIPLLLAKYDRLKELKFGEVLYSYPRARYLHNLDDFSEILEEMWSNFDEKKIVKWIQINSGPLPAEDMPVRVVNVINSLIRNNKSPVYA